MTHDVSLEAAGRVKERAAAGRSGHAARKKPHISTAKWTGPGQGEEKYSQFATG